MPKPDPRSKRGQAADQAPALSRIQQLKRDGMAPRLPPTSAPHIIERLIEIGLTQAAGMGVGPLTWGEIVGWQQATGVTLAPWESRLIRKLSLEYLAFGRLAESETCPAPWMAPVTQREIAAEQARLERVLG